MSPPSPSTPGQVTIQVEVPYRVVGLVVGLKGATIKRIQQQTHTYIVTPSRDKEPVFEVMGTPECVEKAKIEIESHIAMRTGHIGQQGLDENISDFHTNGIDSGFHDMPASLLQQQALLQHGALTVDGMSGGTTADNAMFSFPNNSPLSSETKMLNGFSSYTSNSSTSSAGIVTTPVTNFGLYDSSDEGIGSPSFGTSDLPLYRSSQPLWPESNKASLSGVYSEGPRRSNSLDGSRLDGFSPSLTDGSSSSSTDHTSVRRIRSDPMTSERGLAALGSFSMLPPTNKLQQNQLQNQLRHQLQHSSQLPSSSGCSSSSSSPTDLMKPDSIFPDGSRLFGMDSMIDGKQSVRILT